MVMNKQQNRWTKIHWIYSNIASLETPQQVRIPATTKYRVVIAMESVRFIQELASAAVRVWQKNKYAQQQQLQLW